MNLKLAALPLLALALTACGGNDDKAGDSSALEMPACADVQTMDTLPKGYDGCTDKDGTVQAAVSYDCADGSQMFVVGEKPYLWTVDGNLTTGDANAYSEAVTDCKG